MIGEALAQGVATATVVDYASIWGGVNTLLIAVVGYFVNSRDRANATAQKQMHEANEKSQRQMYEAMREVTVDLKKLNDAVLSQYVTEEQMKQIERELHRRLDAETQARAASATSFRTELHALDNALARANITVPRPTVGG